MGWQDVVARYLEAMTPAGRHLYREVAVVVSRQNGKSEILVPLIVKRLREGKRIMHTAQDRSLPREIFYRVADIFAIDPVLFPVRNGRPTRPRFANGQEEIRLANGGVYSIVAPTRGGARGPSRDLLIIDEVRELDSWDFIAAAKPTMTASDDPQTVYVSNAGDETSVVLNALRERAAEDPGLAYLEWSAAPSRDPGDVKGWCEANPAMGHEPEGMGSVQANLEAEYRSNRLSGTLSIFETEHLCRQVVSMRERLVNDAAWLSGEAELAIPKRSFMGIAMDPKGPARVGRDRVAGHRRQDRAPAAVRRPGQPDRHGQARARPPRGRHAVRRDERRLRPPHRRRPGEVLPRGRAAGGQQARQRLGPVRGRDGGLATALGGLRRGHRGPRLDDAQGARRVGQLPGRAWQRRAADHRGARRHSRRVARLRTAGREEDLPPSELLRCLR
jgi:hypothetical protein